MSAATPQASASAGTRAATLLPRASTTVATRYINLPNAEMADVSRRLEAQLKGVVRPSAQAIKPFAGTVEAVTSDAAAVLRLVPMVFVDDPLRFDAQSKRFEGRIAVGLAELGHTGAPKKLAEAINFQLLGDVQSVPDVAPVSTTSPPFASCRVFASDPGEAMRLRVMTNLSAEPVALTLPVERAHLALRGKTHLQGWGLESAEVIAVASDGAASKGRKVALEVQLGGVTAGQVVLDDAGTALATLRSESIGVTQLRAGGSQFRDARLALSYEAPWRSVGARLLGGVTAAVGALFGTRLLQPLAPGS